MIKLYRKSFSSIAVLGAGNIVNALFGFAFFIAAAKFLPIDEFGKYSLLISILVSFSKLLDFGSNSMFVTKSIEQDEKDLIDQFAGIKFFLLMISLPLSIMILHLLGFNELKYYILFILGMFFYSINYFLFSIFQRYQIIASLILINMVSAFIKLVFAVMIFSKLIVLNPIEFFAVFSLSLSPSILFYFCIPKNYKNIKMSFSNIKKIAVQILSPGISQVINEGLPAINNSLAKIFTGLANTGLFSLAEKISSIFSIASFTIFTVILPGNAYRKRERKSYDYIETIILSLAVLFLAVILIILFQIFIPWFFANKFNGSLVVLDLLVFSACFTSIHIFLENYFFVQNKTNLLAYISIGKLITLLIFSSLLTPYYSIVGLAWAQLLSSFGSLAIVVYLIINNKNLVKTTDFN